MRGKGAECLGLVLSWDRGMVEILGRIFRIGDSLDKIIFQLVKRKKKCLLALLETLSFCFLYFFVDRLVRHSAMY